MSALPEQMCSCADASHTVHCVHTVPADLLMNPNNMILLCADLRHDING